jgi:hypothetical protein
MSSPPLTRQQLASFLPSPALISAFENLFQSLQTLDVSTISSLQTAVTSLQTSIGVIQTALNSAQSNLTTINTTLATYGSMAGQAASSVAITGGNLDGVNIGVTTPGSGNFSSLANNLSSELVKSNVNLTNGAGASAGTLTNAPAAGNPTKWIPINDNGTIRKIPSW